MPALVVCPILLAAVGQASAAGLRFDGGTSLYEVPPQKALDLTDEVTLEAWVQADRMGRERVVNLAMTVSGLCCVLIGFLFHAPFILLVAVTWIWGFFVVADSAQFSALVTEVGPSDSVGTALTLQTSLGFLLSMVTIQGLPAVTGLVGWAWTFPILALGPAAGIASISRLGAGRRTPPASRGR